MRSNAMFVDHWEEFNQKRVEFRNMIFSLLVEAYDEGNGAGYFGGDHVTGKLYAEEKIKELF